MGLKKVHCVLADECILTLSWLCRDAHINFGLIVLKTNICFTVITRRLSELFQSLISLGAVQYCAILSIMGLSTSNVNSTRVHKDILLVKLLFRRVLSLVMIVVSHSGTPAFGQMVLYTQPTVNNLDRLWYCCGDLDGRNTGLGWMGEVYTNERMVTFVSS
jgi:hypothetical protein